MIKNKDNFYELIVTEEEMKTLLVICNNIGGDYLTRRKHTERLKKCILRHIENYYEPVNGTITFIERYNGE